MTFFSLTAPQGERSDHARMGIAEPKGCYTVGVESTVYRGMLSDQLNIDSMTITKVLIHCVLWKIVLLRTKARVAGELACT